MRTHTHLLAGDFSSLLFVFFIIFLHKQTNGFTLGCTPSCCRMSCRLCPVINQPDGSAAATRRRRDDESRAVNATAVSQVTDQVNHLMMSSAAYLQHDSHVGERTCVPFVQILNLQVRRPISWFDPQLCCWDLSVFVSVSASGDSASEVQPQTPNDFVVLAAG